MDNPCHKHCPERASGCHISCEKYAEYRKYLDEKNAEMRKLDCIADYHRRKKEEQNVKGFKNPTHYKGGGQN